MTIKDLAARSGYAVGTVSRVLNGQPNVSEKARREILAIAGDAGFELNTNAKYLKQQHSDSILAVVRGVHNELFAALVEQLQGLAAEAPCRLVVDYIDEAEDEVKRGARLAREMKPRGILFLGGNSAHFAAGFDAVTVPAVLVTNSAAGLGFGNLSSVTTDDRAAAAAAIGFLAERGHRRIAVIGGDLANSDTSAQRYAGCMDAFAARGIAFDPALRYGQARYSFREGYDAMTRLLRRDRSVTAVFAMSDMMAIGAARAAADAGLSVPGDLSLIGFDGLPICDYYTPRLTTVVQRTAFLAGTGFRILQDAVRGAQARHVSTPGELSERDSVRDISGRKTP